MSPARLGFGTAPVLGRIARKQSLRALHLAYEQGVRHFDTARSYGWGEAESVLGAALAKYPRESYTLVSKCGILPAKRSSTLSLAKKLARQTLRLVPGAHGFVRGVASLKTFQPTSTYDVGALAQSFATSLQELNTSYLDVLLLHNFEVGKPGLHDVVKWLRELQSAGRIRRYGFSIEGDLTAGLTYLSELGLLADAVVQVPVSEALLNLPEPWRGLPIIAHSPYRYLAQRQATDSAGLRELLRVLAQSCRCEALVCSMFTPVHIAENVAAARYPTPC